VQTYLITVGQQTGQEWILWISVWAECYFNKKINYRISLQEVIYVHIWY
jgi:hypothetical protein